MDVLQSWLLVGVPALLVLAALFVGHSRRRAIAGYIVLAATLVFFVTVPRDRVSATAFGLLAVFLVAVGRGTHTDDVPEHHQIRRRFTTTSSGG